MYLQKCIVSLLAVVQTLNFDDCCALHRGTPIAVLQILYKLSSTIACLLRKNVQFCLRNN